MWKTKVKKEERRLATIKEENVLEIAIRYLEHHSGIKVPMDNFSRFEREEILKLANNIDVTKIGNIVTYGDVVFDFFEQNKQLLLSKKYSDTMLEVVNEVSQLANKVSKINEDFEFTLSKSNNIKSNFLSFFTGGKIFWNIEKLIDNRIEIYELIFEIRENCNKWEKILEDDVEDITNVAMIVSNLLHLTEKYIVAGEIIKENIEVKLSSKENKQVDEELKLTYKQFLIIMTTLYNARAMCNYVKIILGGIIPSILCIQDHIKTWKKEVLSLIEFKKELRNYEVLKLDNEIIANFTISFDIIENKSKNKTVKFLELYDTECIEKVMEVAKIRECADEMFHNILPETAKLNKIEEELENIMHFNQTR